jgi:negative regulator of flagellin synthesis FlgM
MKINRNDTGRLRPENARETNGPRALPIDQPKPRESERSERRDRVEISDAGRARAAKIEPTVAGAPNRLAEIRQRIVQGAYDASDVVESVARRILDRGDL